MSHNVPSKSMEQVNCVTSKGSFFESGLLNDRLILTVVDASFISSTVKMYEVIQKQPGVPMGVTSDHAIENVNVSIKDFRVGVMIFFLFSLHLSNNHDV